MNNANEFNVEKYLIWNTTVKINQPTGIENMISVRPTMARNHDLVLIRSQMKMNRKLAIANMASFVTILRMTSPIIDVMK
jgi:hypothetical protein